MSGFDISVATQVLKRVQKGLIIPQMQDESTYYKERKKVSQKFGAGLYNAVQFARDQSQGNRNNGANDNQALPDYSKPRYDQPTFDTIRTYGRLNMTGKAASRLTGEEQSFLARGVAERAMDRMKAFMRDADFRYLNTSTATGNKKGCRGVLNDSAYNASGTAQTFTLDVATSPTHRRYRLGQGLAEGVKLQVYAKTTWLPVATITVVSVDEEASTFTGILSDDLAADADEWYLFRDGDFDNDVSGVGDLLDDGTYTSTYAGLTTSGLWAGKVLGNSGTLRDFSPDLMDKAKLLARKQNGDKKMQAWMTYGLYEQLLAYIQRSVVLNKDMGNAPVRANVSGDVEAWGANITTKTCALMPAHEIFVMQPDLIDVLEQHPYGPLNLGDGGSKEVLWQRLPGYDTWEAVYLHEAQQRTLQRNAHVKIEDLNQSLF